MKDAIFNPQNFALYEFRRTENYHTDMSKGAPLYYIAHMKKGNVRLITQNAELTVREGETFFIPIGLPYHSYWYGADPVVFFSFGFRYFPNIEPRDYALQIIPTDPSILSMIYDIPVNAPPDCTAFGKLFCLLGALQPRMKRKNQSAKSVHLQKAIDYMYAHNQYDIPTLAQLCNMSESGFYAAFKRELGMTPVQAKQKIQIERAELLLRTTDLPIEEIAEKSGFQTAQHFRKVFYKLHQQTPRHFRKMI